ncbi:MAG: ATP-binding protein [Acidobacteriota bacterium]|jgi:two-component system phosphate regulon sensor histidine kinase PhoR|nr:ATP-binding protein [Acidobacteriota bacterium]
MTILSNFFTTPEIMRETPRLHLSDILETMREGILIVGEDMRVVTSNTAAHLAFARYGETFDGKRLSEIIRDFSLHNAFTEALKSKKSSQVRIEIINHNTRIFDVRITPLQVGDTKQVVGVFYDVTQVEHLERVRQEFLSNISHELRTPLTSILAFVETLEDGAIDDEANNRRFLSIIQKNAERMHHLINDISELSSIEAGKVKIEVRKINLFALVREIFASLSNKAKQRNVLLKNEVSEETFVMADVIRLEQMLTNLVDNAIKFNSVEGMVIVSYEQQDVMDIINVSDTGEGIMKEHQQRIFERFYRIDRARTREVGGTGLGLAIVKHLAKLHGGEVSLDSTLGEGSTFKIKLPQETPHLNNNV